ncbi:MAG: Isoprenyl transferase [Parcubacteria group bacterium GW2011_GWA2_50_10b]|nr:MAG: Isoprenyl transferase [Parcubacteria group bacterium GW2011_GWA2_50_10b]
MVPKCLVIIPDGNRRWARKNHRRDITGHTRGLFNCRSITRAAFERGVTHVVLWAASELNLYRRPPNEIMHIFRLLKHELRSRLKNPEEIGFHLCGDWRRFTQDQELFMLADEVQEKSARYTKQQLTVLFGYSGRAELVDAIKKLSASGCIQRRCLLRTRLRVAYCSTRMLPFTGWFFLGKNKKVDINCKDFEQLPCSSCSLFFAILCSYELQIAVSNYRGGRQVKSG